MVQELSRYGVGGSEAAAALGVNPYQSPIALWQRKRAELAGEPDPFPVVENDPIRWGKYLEEPVRRAYADRFGVNVETPPGSIFHPVHTWRRATPDGLVMGESVGGRYGLEIKTASYRMADAWGPDGTDEVPEHYAIQCLWYCHVLDIDRWDVAVLIGGSDFRCYTLQRDAELERVLVNAIDEFWNRNVLGGIEPDVDGSDDFRSYLINKWPAKGGTIKADERLEELVKYIGQLRQALALTEGELRLAENELRVALGDETVLQTSHGNVYCRARNGREIVDWKAIATELTDGDALRLRDLARQHTTRARSSRPLLFPRSLVGKADASETP